MGGMRATLPFLLVAALVHQSIALKCSAGCVGSSGNVFKYQPGTVYKYEMEGTSVMTLAGADGDAAKMTVKANADVSALPNCAFSISLTNLQITDKEGKSGQGDKGQPVIFSMNNGVVTSDICSAKDESIDTLNIKRAIISLLQSSSETNSKSEIDIFGTCPTDTSVHKSGSKLKVKKTRNLINCAHRQNLMIPFTTTHYHYSSDMQSAPWISANQKIEQDVDGQVKWAMSKEDYSMPPAAGIEAGGTITVTTKLSLKGTGGGAAPPAGVETERSIILGAKEHSGENQVKNAGNILKKICEGSQGEIGQENANQFAYLAYLLSRSNKQTMTTLFNQIKQGQICADKDSAKKILLDAIFDSQSADSVQIMADLLKNKEVTGLKAKLWYGSLGSVRHATLPSLKSAAGMLDGDAPSEAYLGAGSLLGRYCHAHSCENVPEVNQLQKKLSVPLTKGCKAANLAEEDKLLASIKGLGNSGYLGGPIVKQLVQCASDHSVRSRVRAASLDALRTDPNKENIKKAAIAILKDKNEDSEMRIKAYLVIASCPCGKMAGVIRDVLEHEHSFQVGNFIVGHLRNIRSSKNPEKSLAQAHFSGILAPRSYPFDFRKYSTNAETSYMLDSLNVGGSSESNIIYSQKSWIPRTVSVNMTSHLFGNNFNIFEMDARAENLERLLERIVGPKGYLMGDPSDIAVDANSMWGKFMGRAKQAFRPKRAVSQNEIDALANQVNMGADAGEKDESLDLSLKLFGSEVAWIPLHGANLDKPTGESIDSAFDLLDQILDKAKNIDVDYTKHKVLAEGVVAYPTAMGVPLKLKGIVTIALRVKMDGKLDIPAILRDPKNAMVKFQMIPSGSLSGSLIAMMESGGLNTGVKIVVNSHSSTGSDITLRLLEGKGIDVKVGLPLAKQDVISVNTKIISFSDTVQGKSVKPVAFNVKREEYSGCFDQISEVIGLTFCGEASAPWDGHRIISPAFGPASVSARIEKEDPSLTNFHFKTFFNVKADAPQHHFEIVLDTPNSKKERRFGILVENTMHPDFALKATVDSPFGGMNFESSAINSAAEKSVNAELKLSEDEMYSFKAGVKQAGADKYKPFLEYNAPEKGKSRFSGVSGSKQGGQQVSVTGDIKVDGKKLIFEGVKVSISRQDYTVDGTAWDEKNNAGVDLKVTYSDDVLNIKAKSEQVAPHHWKRSMQVASQKYPDVSVSASWDLDFVQNKKQTSLKSDVIVVHGPDPNSETARVTVTNSFSSRNDDKGNLIDVNAKNLVQYPIVNLKGEVNFHGNAQKFGYKIDGSFETYNVGSSLEVVMAKDFSVDFSGKLMDNSVTGHTKSQSVGPHKTKLTNSLELQPGGKYQLNALITHKFEDDDIDAHVEAKITLPTEPKNIKIKTGVKDNKQSHNGVISVEVDGKPLVDGQVAITKGNDLAGNLKLVLSESVDAKGDFKFSGGNLDGKGVINLLKAKKKIEGKTHMTIQSPHYKGTVDLCADSKCVKLATDSTINKDNFETKNKLELPAGLIVSAHVKVDEGKGTHSAEAEMHDASGRQTKVTYSSSRHMRPGDVDVEYFAGIEHRAMAGGKSGRVEAKFIGKHIDLEKETGDGQIVVTYHTPEDKDFSLHSNFKRAPAGEKWIHNAEIGATGSLLDSPINLKFESEADDKMISGQIVGEGGNISPGSYHLTMTLGKDLTIESQGKAGGHALSNELNIILPQAKQGIKNFKWSTNSNIDLNPQAKLKTSNTIKWDDKFIKSNAELNDEDDGINFNVDFEGDSIPKRTISGNAHGCLLFKADDGPDNCHKGDGSLVFTWDNKKADVSFVVDVDEAKKAGHLQLKGTLPDGTKYDINSKGRCDSKGDEVSLHGETTATVGSKKYTGSADVEVHKNKYNVDFILDQPEGKSQFKSGVEKKSDYHYTSGYVMSWISNGGGKMVGDSEFNFESENNFYLIANVDSPKLNLNKFHFEAKVTPDKKLSMNMENDGKTIAAAKSSYQYTKDGTKRKVEGSGNINIEGKDYPLTYDTTFDASPEMSTIMQLDMNVKAGDRTFKFNSEGNPNNFHVKRTYCKAPNDCSDAEVLYENKHLGALNYEQTFLYKLDLSMFNPKLKDLKISTKTKREGLIFDQNIDLDMGDSKLKYVTYIHANKAGATLTLPQRTVAAEAQYGFPKKDKHSLKFEGSVWLDKAKAPNKKTHFLIQAEAGQNKDAYTAQSETRFNSPGLSKPLIIKGKGLISNQYTQPSGEGSFEVDIFKKPQMKIVGNWRFVGKKTDKGFDAQNVFNVKSEGLKLNINFDRKIVLSKEASSWTEKLTYTNAKGEAKEAIAKYELTPKKLHAAIKITDTSIVDYTAKWDIGEDTMTVSESIDLLGSKYSDHFEAKLHPLQANYKLINNQGCGSKALTVAAIYEMGKAAKLDAGFDGKTLLSGEISLAEADFLKPQAKLDKDAVNTLKDCYEKSGKHADSELFRIFQKLYSPFEEEVLVRQIMFRDAVPTLDDISKYYHEEVEKIQDEISADKTLQGTLNVIKESLSTILENGAQLIEEIQTITQTLKDQFQQPIDKIITTVNEIIPMIKKSFQDLVKATAHLSDDVVHMVVSMFDLVLQEISAHSEDLSSVMKSIGDVMEEYGQVFMKYAYQINKEVQEFSDSTFEKLRELPMADLIEEQMENIKAFIESNDPGVDQSFVYEIAEEVVGTMDEILNALKDSNFPPLEQLIETLKTWIKKAFMEKEPVDNVEYAKKAAKELFALIKHIMALVDDQISANEDVLNKSRLPALSALPLSRIPTGLLRLSGLSWITSKDLPTMMQVIATYWPDINPDNWLPPFTARAYLLGGSEIITFDGNHITVDGDCHYVLTQDYIDGNFSVVAQFKGGKLAGIQVTDGKDTIELRHAKKPLLNGKESEFPIFQGQLRSWKRAAVVAVSTKSGLKILCTPDCLRCKFRLDGFYFGRVRGLLGTYDYEQYDDLTLPSGEITEDTGKFLSAWSIGQCAPKSHPAPPKEPTCMKTFSSAPDFLACYHLFNPKPYRDACNSLAAKETTPEGLQDVVCNVAFAYSLQCQTKIPVAVPQACLKCAKTKTNVFETTATIEPPFKKADVVFTIERFDTNKDIYENVIKPMIPAIKNDLKAKGINDVKFGLVGFGGAKRMWPAYYTNNGKVLSDDLETGNLVFDPKPTGKQLEQAIEIAAAESGVTGKSTTYLDLAEFYPWRLGASKVVFGIHATPCRKSNVLFLLQHLYFIGSYINKGITFHTMSPVANLELPGEDTKNIIAISDDEVFTTSDAGKKPLEGHGNKEAEDKISYDGDVCFTFAHMTGGYVFPAENYLNGGGAEKDAFKKATATAIVESLTSPARQQTQKCSCHPKVNPYDGIFSQADCRAINI